MSEGKDRPFIQVELPGFRAPTPDTHRPHHSQSGTVVADNKEADAGIRGALPTNKEGSKEHPWGIGKGTKVYAGKWSENGNNEIGIMPHPIKAKSLFMIQDGPYTSMLYEAVDTTPQEIKDDLVRMGVDRGWVIRQQVKGRKHNPWFGSQDIEE